METIINNEKPALDYSGEGFFIFNSRTDFSTVQYKDKLLYSKYDPVKSIESIICKMDFLPQTLVILFSPVLWYGIDFLFEKLPEHCKVLAFERDKLLFDFALKNLPQKFDIEFEACDDLSKLEARIEELSLTGNYKRAVRIDFSGGVHFEKLFYDQLFIYIQNTVNLFWKNRITLVKMGKLFSKNIWTNLVQQKKILSLESVCKSVSKPILVCGAGESLDCTIKYLKSNNCSNQFFILACDAALNSLVENGIIPDGCVGVESQLAIQSAYIGNVNPDFILFTDLSSRPGVVRNFKKVVFFSSEFVKCSFLNSLIENKIVSSLIKPMGSVGLYAVYVALALRSSPQTQIFVSGLDFSYSVGRTHCACAPAFKRQFYSSNFFKSIENIAPSFSAGSSFCISKNGTKLVTTSILSSYAEQFNYYFSSQINLFDCTDFGLPLNIPHKNLSEVNCVSDAIQINNCLNKFSDVSDFVLKEKLALEELKDLLVNGENSKFINNSLSLDQQIFDLLSKREYLYLHFPDGYKFSMELNFLKRVRAEIDVFLKILS